MLTTNQLPPVQHTPKKKESQYPTTNIFQHWLFISFRLGRQLRFTLTRCLILSFLAFLLRIDLPFPMATTTNNPNPNNNDPPQENPNKTLDPTVPKPDLDPSLEPTPPPTADKDAGESKETPAPAEPGNDAPLSDIQKKVRRAERFGISVQLSEKEKRNSRAERFHLFSLPFDFFICEDYGFCLTRLGFEIFIRYLWPILFHSFVNILSIFV